MKSKNVIWLVILLMVTGAIVCLGFVYSNSKKPEQSRDSFVAPLKSKEVDTFQDVYFQGDKSGFTVFIKGSKVDSNKYISYRVNHQQKDLNKKDSTSNYNVWKLDGAYEASLVNGVFKKTKEVVTTGEWELALKEQGASDFIGGSLHGDEITTLIDLEIDGEKVNEENISKFNKDVKEIKFIVNSELYRDNTMSEELQKIGLHTKLFTFNRGGILIDQSVEFLEDIILDRSYLAMLPILRKSNGDSGEQVTDSIRVSTIDAEFDVGEANFDIPEIKYIEENKATISGKSSGIIADVEIVSKSAELPTVFFISNSLQYNKLYFSYNEDGYTAQKNEIWNQTTKYFIDTSN
ncbi:hypothetical protein [Carnobacterium maltaromaticum]|uniref:hypothetical protein n=1 Tax=Carnobacterium maltaromaticum TaxID=2751 RepID=UPI0039AE9E42